MSVENDFKLELKALLSKYNAFISYDFAECADTHGLSNSGMAIYMNDKKIQSLPYLTTVGAGSIKTTKIKT